MRVSNITATQQVFLFFSFHLIFFTILSELKRITARTQRLYCTSTKGSFTRYCLLKCTVYFSSFLSKSQLRRTVWTSNLITLLAAAIACKSDLQTSANIIPQSYFCFQSRATSLALKYPSDFTLKVHLVLVIFSGKF